jgi:hypothetical protein
MKRAGSVSGGTEARDVRLRGVVRLQRQLHERLRGLAGPAPNGRQRPDTIEAVHAEILEQLADIGVLLERAGVGPETLPDPTRRAYQWLSYLADEPRLREHLHTLRLAIQVDPRPRIEITHLPGLYRGFRHGEDIRLAISEGFVMAPADVIAGLVKIALPYTRKEQHRARVHAYAEGPAYRERHQAVEQAGGAIPAPKTAGRTHDLEAIFRWVNRDYFESRLGMPRVQWNHISTLREFGRFEPATDTIVISRRLDAPDVPEQVVAYVLYHELLHRVLGARREGSRRRYHTSGFHKAERRFRGHAQAEQFLNALSHRGRQYSLTPKID